MNIVVIYHPYHHADKMLVTAIPADKIINVKLEIGGTGAKSSPLVYYVRVQLIDGWEVFDFNYDETSAKICFNSIINQMKGE